MDKFENLNISSIDPVNPQGLKNLGQNSNDTSVLFCIKCKKTPKLEMQNLIKFNIECKCYKKELNLEDVNKLIIDLEDAFNNNLNVNKKCLKCKGHEKLFQFFCNKCDKNLCKKCMQRHHCDETLTLKDLTDFNILNHKISEFCDFLDKSFKEDNFFSKEIDEIINSADDKTNITQNLKKLISTLIYEYNII